MAVRINGDGLSFAGCFAGVTMIVPMRPFLAGRIAPGALIVHSEPDTGQAHRCAEPAEQAGLHEACS
ncbi:hypothetical protein V1286_005175 [Bradyrhizobium algeriense]|uniref:Uncharacterized protein n=1 Tax=Bradyrhizobium algeriense TaxID=634784 RepID=A0ABU8BHQ9_9BRAD